MAAKHILTLGYGFADGTKYISTLGYDIEEVVVTPPQPYRPGRVPSSTAATRRRIPQSSSLRRRPADPRM